MSAASDERVVDVHVHASPPAFRQALAEAAPDVAARFAYLRHFADGLEDRAARMRGLDEAGVDLAVLSVPPPAAEVLGPSRAGALAAAIDDELLADAAADPDRLRVLITVPVSDPDAALRHVERLGDHPLVAGMYALAVHRERTLDDPALEPVWAAAADRGLPLVIHPAFEPAPTAFQDWLLPTSLDAVYGTSVAAARLMLSGTLDRVPGLTLVVPHLGGTLPYLAQRLDDQSGTGAAQHDVSTYLRSRVVIDTCSFHPPALRCAVDTVGADRVLLGSDFPFRGPVSRATADVRDFFADADADRDGVLGRTAASVFRIPVGATAPTPSEPSGALA